MQSMFVEDAISSFSPASPQSKASASPKSHNPATPALLDEADDESTVSTSPRHPHSTTIAPANAVHRSASPLGRSRPVPCRSALALPVGLGPSGFTKRPGCGGAVRWAPVVSVQARTA